MGVLTLILVAVLVAAFLGRRFVKELSMLALAIGFLGQLIGLFGAFQGIESMGGVSQAMLAGGLKVSSITAIYGLLIYCIGLIVQLVHKYKA